jgi:hypothetical protein
MGTLIDRHRPQIEALCRTYRVKRLDLFGSAVREDFDPVRSDVDLRVEFGRALTSTRSTPTWTCAASCPACWGAPSTWSCRPAYATATSRRSSRPPASPCLPRDPRALLADVLDTARSIERFRQGLDLDGFRTDELVRSDRVTHLPDGLSPA